MLVLVYYDMIATRPIVNTVLSPAGLSKTQTVLLMFGGVTPHNPFVFPERDKAFFVYKKGTTNKYDGINSWKMDEGQ